MSRMREQINILISMQQVDDQIVQVEGSLLEMDQKQAGLDSKIQAFKKTLDTEAGAFEDMRKAYREFESDLKMNSSLIEKSQEKLRVVKTNKEYQSILKEIDELKKQKSDLEDNMLETLEDIEKLELVVKEKKNELSGIETRIANEKKQILLDQEKKKNTFRQLGIEKENIKKALDPENLNIMTSVRKKVRGKIVVPVQRAVCLGCNLNIPPQLFNELQRFDSLKLCPNCQRIIYWQEVE